MTKAPGKRQPTDADGRFRAGEDLDRQLADAALRTRRHWFDDGIWEIAIGAIFAILGVYFVLEHAVAATAESRGAAANVLLNLLLPAIVIAAALLGRKFIHRAKERLVYPRAGFVRHRQRRRGPRWLPGAIGGIVSALIVVLVRTAPGAEAWIPAGEGVLFGAGAWGLSRFSGVPRIASLGIVALVTGVVVSLFHASTTLDGALFFGTIGLAAIASGTLGLCRFLRGTPPPEEP